MGRLTDTAIRKALRDGGSDKMLSDGGARGSGALVLRIRSSGAAAWYVKQWHGGKPSLARIGPYPAITLAEARRRYAELVGQAKAGESIRATVARAAIERAGRATLRDLLEGYAGQLEGRRSGAETARLLLTGGDAALAHLPPDLPASDLHPEAVAKWLSRWAARGSIAAGNKARAALSAAYAWAMRNDLAPGRIAAGHARRFGLDRNPVAAVPTLGERGAGERWLTLDELRAFWAWAASGGAGRTDPRAILALKLIALSGQRVEQITGLSLDNLETRAGWIVWPAEAMKARRAHGIPCAGAAGDMLGAAMAHPMTGRQIFPSWKHPARGFPSPSLSRITRAFTEAHGLERFGPRDLRRSWRVHSLRAGVTAEGAAAIMAHAWGPRVAARHYSADAGLDRLKLESAAIMSKYWQDAGLI